MLSQAWLFVFFFGESFADCLSDAIYTVRIYEIGQTVVIFLWRTELVITISHPYVEASSATMPTPSLMLGRAKTFARR